MNIDELLVEELSKTPGAWSVVQKSDHWYGLQHTGTDQTIWVRKVGELGAFIIKTADMDLHWTGHKLDVGLREASDYLEQRYKKR